MKWRLAVLVTVFLARLWLNYVVTGYYRNGEMISLHGRVVILTQNSSMCVIKIDKFWIKNQGYCPFRDDDDLKATGRIRSEVIDRFLGRIWLTDQEISLASKVERKATGIDVINALRQRLVGLGQKMLPDPEAGLVLGVVLGYKKAISAEIYDKLIQSGTIHIIVASGFNVMIVGSIILALCLLWLPRKAATFLAVTAMVIYAALAGGEAPVIRAVIMGTIGLVGLATGRRSGTLWGLLLTLGVMAAIKPLLLEEVSFQLTASSSFGVFWLGPKIVEATRRRLERLSVGRIILGSELVTTASAMVFTAPVIWWHFQRLSLIGLLSNILILPLVPILMLVSGVMLVLGLIMPVSWLVVPVYGLAHTVMILISVFGV